MEMEKKFYIFLPLDIYLTLTVLTVSLIAMLEHIYWYVSQLSNILYICLPSNEMTYLHNDSNNELKM